MVRISGSGVAKPAAASIGARISSSSATSRAAPTFGTKRQSIAFNGSAIRSSSRWTRSEEHTSELQSLMRISYAVFCLKKKNKQTQTQKMKKIYYHNYYTD